MKLTITQSCAYMGDDGNHRHLDAGSTVDLPIETAAQLVYCGRAAALDAVDHAAVRSHLRAANDKALTNGYRGSRGSGW